MEKPTNLQKSKPKTNRNNKVKTKNKFKSKRNNLKKNFKGPHRGKSSNQELKPVKVNVHRRRLEKKEEVVQFSSEQTSRTKILLTEDSGFLEAESGETTTQFRQKEISQNVDITTAAKQFDLQLHDFGPYRMKYTRNGRHLLLGGAKGHVAAFDWVTKKLHCEMNIMESVHDICWLHIETMFAVAQKDWVYIYDHQGIEIHCLKKLNKVMQMEFLPYHFLLGTSSSEGILSWLDISVGSIVAQWNTRLDRLGILTHNPYNAVLCLGQTNGVVSMWSPNVKDPLLKLLCHKSPLTAMHVDPKGMYMATAAGDRSLKIWDVRKLNEALQSYKLKSTASSLAFSQKSMLAMGMGNIVEVYRDCCIAPTKRAYLRHCFNNVVGNMNFCPFEDMLGVATARGFSSLIVPGAGEANFDALEINPYQTKVQRKEAEVKALLEKIQPEFITLNPDSITKIDAPTLRDKIEAKQKALFLKPPKMKYEPRTKANAKGGSVQKFRTKKIVTSQAKKEFVKAVKEQTKPANTKKLLPKDKDVLSRFSSSKR